MNYVIKLENTHPPIWLPVFIQIASRQGATVGGGIPIWRSSVEIISSFSNYEVVECWHGCLGWGADLHIAQQMPRPLTISCSSKSRLVLTFLVLPFWYLLTQVVQDKFQKSSKTVVCVCVCGVCHFSGCPNLRTALVSQESPKIITILANHCRFQSPLTLMGSATCEQSICIFLLLLWFYTFQSDHLLVFFFAVLSILAALIGFHFQSGWT